MAFAALLIAVLFGSSQDQRVPGDCLEWRECRQLALDAAAREDYETFHDLAWRAVQMGPKNDPSLMYLLARAQSRSGRPSDALVMLSRLLDRGAAGVVSDSIAAEDFQRTRALPGWTAVRERIEAASATVAVATPPPVLVGKKSTPEVTRPKPDPPASAPAIGLAALERTLDSGEALRFSTPGMPPVGLAYDAVSRRFVVADRATRKLTVLDEFSHHAATLAGAQAAFGDISAFEIDPREGNLWVVSAEPGGAGGTTLHKLQLISGRVLGAFPLPAGFAPGRFADVAVSPQGDVLALDAAQARIFRLRAATLQVVTTLKVDQPASLAAADGGVAYVVHEHGLLRVDFSTGAVATVTTGAAKSQDLTGLGRVRWYRGALVGLQKQGETWKAVRLVLDRTGRTVRALEIIDPSVSAASPTAATIAGDTLFYLTESTAGEAAIRRVRLK